MIAIVDYQMGNLRSVQKAFLKVGGRAVVTSEKKKIIKADKVVLPGVGAFGDGMKELENLGLVETLNASISDGKPFFGICLGMQLLFEGSQEAMDCKGLSVFKGRVKRFPAKAGLKVPHMGWNQIKKVHQCTSAPVTSKKYLLLRDIPDNSYMYFVHSYYCEPQEKDIIAATTDYDIDFACVICRGNVYGCQFHPEKSQGTGLRILENFVKC
jgi:glutamine amidotransferase